MNTILIFVYSNHLRRELISHLKSPWVIKEAKTIDEAIKQLENSNFGFILYEHHKSMGLRMLKRLMRSDPGASWILLGATLTIDIVFQAINELGINTILPLPLNYKDLSDKMMKQLREREKYSILNPETRRHKEDDYLLDLMLNLSQASNIRDFINKYINVIEGMRSLCSLNISVYVENRNLTVYNSISKQLTDIEVFANQFNQVLLRLYINLLRGYFELLHGDLELSMKFYKSSLFLFQWISAEQMEHSLVQYIRDFPLFEDYMDRSIDDVFKDIEFMENVLQDTIFKLLEVNLKNLVVMSDSIFKIFEHPEQSIMYVMILKNNLPVFEWTIDEQMESSVLVSGFIVALSGFLQEVSSSSGDIDTIAYDGGVIIFYNLGEMKYVLISKYDDAFLRIGIRQLALDTEYLIRALPKSTYTTDIVQDTIKVKIHIIFRLSAEVLNYM